MRKRFVVLVAVLMCMLLKMPLIDANAAEDSQSTDIRKKNLLVAIDNSGSMKPLSTVIQEVVQVVFALEELEEDELSVEFLLFNAEETKYFSAGKDLNASMEEKIKNLQEIIEYRGETSVYAGMKGIKEWVDRNTNLAKDASINVFILSDLFSSRDENGDEYIWKNAKKEQMEMNQWIVDWEKLIREDKMNVSFIHWESKTAGENSDHTLKFLEESKDISNGYQVILHKGRIKEYSIDEVHTGEDRNLSEEQVIVSESIHCLLSMIMETDKIYWREAGMIQNPDMSVRIGIPKGKRVFIRIDKRDGKSGAEIAYFGREQECLVETCLEGRDIELYYIRDLERSALEIQAEQKNSRVYYLLVP